MSLQMRRPDARSRRNSAFKVLEIQEDAGIEYPRGIVGNDARQRVVDVAVVTGDAGADFSGFRKESKKAGVKILGGSELHQNHGVSKSRKRGVS